MTAFKHERGIALVIVLWVGLLVAAIAGAFIVDTRNSTQLTRNFVDNAEARAMADGGVHLAVYELLRPDADPPWRRDGRLYPRAVPGGMLEIAVEDEGGKIDLNKANNELLEGLFRSAGIDGNKAGAFVDAIEKIRSDEETSGPATRRGIREPTTGQAFHSVDSLGQVPGMTPDLYALLLPALTVFGRGKLHYLASPREALLAVPDITTEAVDEFLLGRAGEDENGPLDAFLVVGKARSYWRRGDSKFVTVKVLAQTANGAKFVRIAIVELVSKNDQPFIVREWREGDTLSIRRPNPVPAEAGELSGGAT